MWHVACGALVSGLSVPAQAPRLWPVSGHLSKGGMERRAAAAGNALLPTAAALMAAKDSRAAESGAGLVYLRCATGPQGQEAPQDERGVKRDRNEERGRVEIQSRYKDGQRGRGRQLACHDHMRAAMATRAPPPPSPPPKPGVHARPHPPRRHNSLARVFKQGAGLGAAARLLRRCCGDARGGKGRGHDEHELRSLLRHYPPAWSGCIASARRRRTVRRDASSLWAAGHRTITGPT